MDEYVHHNPWPFKDYALMQYVHTCNETVLGYVHV